MVRTASSGALAAVWAAITAIQLYYSLNLQPGAGTSAASATTTATASAAQASASVADFQIFLTLVATGGLYAAVVLLYRSVRQAEAEAAAGTGVGGGARRPSDLVAFVSAAAGVLVFFLFDDVGAVGLAAARVLPAASIATFFVGMLLIILAHIRAGGEGGGGGGAVAGEDEAIQAPVWVVLVTKMAFAAAAGLVALMTIALCAKY